MAEPDYLPILVLPLVCPGDEQTKHHWTHELHVPIISNTAVIKYLALSWGYLVLFGIINCYRGSHQFSDVAD